MSEGAAVDPVPHVMRLGPPGRCGAAGVGAAPVAAPQPAPLGPGEQPRHPTQVQVLPRGTEHVRDQRRVARDPAQHLRRQQHPGRGRAEHLPGPGPRLQVGQRDGHVQRRRATRGPVGALPVCVESTGAAAHLGQGLHPSLPGWAQVPLARSPRSGSVPTSARSPPRAPPPAPESSPAGTRSRRRTPPTAATTAPRSPTSPAGRRTPPPRRTRPASRGRSLRIWFAPQVVPSSSKASATVGTASGASFGSNRVTSPRAVKASAGDTVASLTPAHTTPSGVSGSGSAAASGANDPPARPAPATSTASRAT